MDQYFDDVYTSLFYKWILKRDIDGLDILPDPKHENIILVKGKNGYGKISFHILNIIELEVVNQLTNNSDFYLHFQMTNLSHAIELFNEMVDCIQELNQKAIVKVLLCCSGGLTTSFFADKMMQAIELLDLNYSIEAMGIQNAYTQGNQYDIILIAPQISYEYNKLAKAFHTKVVLKIPPRVFANYDVKKMFEIIQKQINNRNRKHRIPEFVLIEIPHTMLAISLFRNDRSVHLKYVLVNKERKILASNEIIKNGFKITDLYDIIDTLFTNYKDIQSIGLSLPARILGNGFVDKTSLDGLNLINFVQEMNYKYPNIAFKMFNDANMASIGYYSSQNEFSNMVCLFQPVYSPSGAGIIIDGKLVKGKGNVAGEMHYMPVFDPYYQGVMKIEEKNVHLNVVSQTLRNIISVLGPEAIVLYDTAIPEVDALIKILEESIPNDAIPKIIKIDELQNYILTGLIVSLS